MKTNYDYYKDEIIEIILNCESSCDFKRKHIFKTKYYCGVNCDTCHSKVREWLNAEYKEPVTVSKIEFTILNEVDNKWKYIARDSDGDLYLYKDRPDQGEHGWIDHKNDYYHHFYAFNELFKFVKWEDEEPYEIAKLIADYEKENEDE